MSSLCWQDKYVHFVIVIIIIIIIIIIITIVFIICAAIEEIASETKPNVHVTCFSFILINIFACTHAGGVKLQYCILEQLGGKLWNNLFSQCTWLELLMRMQ
jgi:hypothetical protein